MDVQTEKEGRVKLRIKYKKHGRIRYIGHLDTQRYFQRVIRRAGLKVLYSGGFSPHQKMSFAMPLSVGYESDAEYFDLEVESAESSEAVIAAMNNEQAEGIEVTDCVLLPEKCENAMASVRYADYFVSFKNDLMPRFDIEKAVKKLNDSNVLIVRKEVKKAKKGRRIKEASYATKTMNDKSDIVRIGDKEYKEKDIRPFIHEIYIKNEGIFMKVSAGSKDNIKPEPVIGAIYEQEGSVLPELSLKVLRCELYSDGFKTLLESGTVF